LPPIKKPDVCGKKFAVPTTEREKEAFLNHYIAGEIGVFRLLNAL